jgi:hypothetical protein
MLVSILNFCCFGSYDATWDGSKGGKFKRTREREEDETWSFKKE